MRYRLNITSLLAIVALLIVFFSTVTIWFLGNQLVLDINRITIEKRITSIEPHVEEWGRYILLSRQTGGETGKHKATEVQGASMLAVLDTDLNVISEAEGHQAMLPTAIDMAAKPGYVLDMGKGDHRVIIPFSIDSARTSFVQFEDELFAERAIETADTEPRILSGFVVARISTGEKLGEQLLRRIMLIFGVIVALVVSSFLYFVNRLIGRPIRLLTREIQQGGDKTIIGLKKRIDLKLAEAEKLSRAFAIQHQKTLDVNENLEATVETRTKELQNMTEQLRQLAFRATHDRDDDARRIAAEVHDNLCSKIMGLKNTMDMYHGTITTDSITANEIEKYLEQLRIINDDARSIISRYRYNTTNYLGLESGLDDTLQYVMASSPTVIDLKFSSESTQLAEIDPIAYSEIIKIVQEALANINKHTEATTVELLTNDEADAVRIRIIDNGGGFDGNRDYDSHGLTIMRERAAYIRGSLEILSTRDGTEVSLFVPIGKLTDH